ncbi:hypothetical protein KDH_11470 [Dictyobacter sp. S3.2.2.5]|uniref:Tc toxin complex TcA C-terminal TcB-binding domain-containing protein n=1 Tax=Dictyobacter halimunensis TaxID=3026934 RepID=A0ABQ6FP43_9CHLR|nr:hypothetical protein KDH_11470 [Dictyobacter sp. S3.2.2.5]
MEKTSLQSFHGYYDIRTRPYLTYRPDLGWSDVIVRHITTEERSISYQFFSHFHPYVAELVKRLIETDIVGLQDADTDYQRKSDGSFVTLPNGKPRPTLYDELFTSDRYNPSPETVQQPYPVKDLDFTSSGAYSVYNWELFYHIPLEIAIHLSKNQHFEDAQKWFHYIFDPTDNSDGPAPERFWKVKSFQYNDVKMIEDILVNLSTKVDPQLYQDTINSIEAWKNAPFRPFVVARYRQTAFMFKAVMAYLDNLIAWGDTLFQQDTGESINEATQLYVLAANILGPRPQEVPQKGNVSAQTYASLRNDLDAFGNALRELETSIPFDIAPHPSFATRQEQLDSLRSAGNVLYFCVPRNDKLLGYWDIVADRLFKIHNSLNFQGIFRQLPLFQPPIDPALLARAAAAGLDVGAIVSGLNQPLPLVRFNLLFQKATEVCQEVKSLGSSLLSAIEKGDNEALAILRAQHEREILEITETVRYQQWQEAIKSREGLEKSLANAIQRYSYYEMQLGKQSSDITNAIPSLDGVDTNGLETMNFTQSEPAVATRNITVDIAQDLSEASGKLISSYESRELDQLSKAQDLQDAATVMDGISAALNLIPQISGDVKPIGVGAGFAIAGRDIARLLSGLAAVLRGAASHKNYEATKAAKIGSYDRRQQEWAYQSNLAAGEITQIFKQLRAAQIRESITQREWHNHQKQIAHAKDIEQFLTDEKVGKETNKDFYLWMKREVKGLYGQCFQFAFNVARKAERALQHELGDPTLTFLQTGYLAGKEGLLAGEQLYQDIKRMEMAYHDLNRREYELTKNVSLLQLDPVALLQLRATGRCTFTLPEELFDLDTPGHYFRRVKTVSVSIPCVVGPYTSVPCTLTLLKSSIRVVSDGDYARTGADDPRFSDYFSSLESIVTSTGQNDSGLFETNLHDERYLPFEGSGAISEWQLELPADLRQFDYETIADVILHVRYTARQGGALLRKAAVANLKAAIENAQTIGSIRLFSIRHEFPSEWARFKNAQLDGVTKFAELSLTLRAEHYPFWSQGLLNVVKEMDFFAQAVNAVGINDKPDGSGNKDTLAFDHTLNLQIGKLTHIPLPAPLGKFTLYLDNNAMSDLWVAVTWGKQ